MPHPHVVFHIGAHKTATTHLQQSISAAADDLAKAGVRFFGPQALRGRGARLEARFALPFNPRKSVADPRPAAVVLEEMAQGADRLVLSEENFVGVLFERNSDGPPHRIETPLYPNAASRVSALAERIAPDGLDLCLGVRDPAGYLNSGYGQAMLAGLVVSEEKFRNQNPPRGVDWADLVTRLKRAPGVRGITIWRQEDYREVLPQILTAMLGRAAGCVAPADGRMNPGLSRAAVEETLRLYRPKTTEPLAREARERWPVGPQNPPYELFGAEDRALSAEFYAAQMRRIKRMEGVVVLTPAA